MKSKPMTKKKVKKPSIKRRSKKVTNRKPVLKKFSHNLNKKILPVLVKLLKTTKGKSKSVNQYWIKNHLGKILKIDVPSRTTRHLIHHIRVKALVKNLIAYTNGYYIAQTKSESDIYLKRVQSHINELIELQSALIKQHKQKFKK